MAPGKPHAFYSKHIGPSKSTSSRHEQMAWRASQQLQPGGPGATNAARAQASSALSRRARNRFGAQNRFRAPKPSSSQTPFLRVRRLPPPPVRPIRAPRHRAGGERTATSRRSRGDLPSDRLASPRAVGPARRMRDPSRDRTGRTLGAPRLLRARRAQRASTRPGARFTPPHFSDPVH